MAKQIECELWVGTASRFFKFGDNFPSIAAAKRYVKSCINCYYEIIKIK